MNKRIQELAEHCTIQYRDGHGGYVDHVDVEKFAELIAAAEREACAKVAEDYWSEGYCDDAVREIAAEIRARGEQ